MNFDCIGAHFALARLRKRRTLREATMPPVIAIIGRPNVGKSTLFNRLVAKRLALVSDMPGLTRDRRESQAEVGGHAVTLIDTAGLREATRRSQGGGLACEHEDIKVVTWPVDEFLRKTRRGELQDAKTLIAGYWLEDNLDRIMREHAESV